MVLKPQAPDKSGPRNPLPWRCGVGTAERGRGRGSVSGKQRGVVPGGDGRRDPIFLALHVPSSGKARSLDETNFNIAQRTVEALLKNRSVLGDDALVILRKTVRRDDQCCPDFRGEGAPSP
jgi:hypothetical protein